MVVTPARLYLIIRIRRRIQLRIADGFDLAFQVEGFVQDGVDGLHGQDSGQPQARENHNPVMSSAKTLMGHSSRMMIQ